MFQGNSQERRGKKIGEDRGCWDARWWVTSAQQEQGWLGITTGTTEERRGEERRLEKIEVVGMRDGG